MQVQSYHAYCGRQLVQFGAAKNDFEEQAQHTVRPRGGWSVRGEHVYQEPGEDLLRRPLQNDSNRFEHAKLRWLLGSRADIRIPKSSRKFNEKDCAYRRCNSLRRY